MKLTRIKAFSLAEILVVITIIGLVVALTAPALYENYMQRHYETAKKVFVSDMRSAVKKMHADDELVGYSSTVEFAEALSNYLKIKKVCGSNASGGGLSNCFSSEFEDGMDNGRCLNSGCNFSSGSGSTKYISSYQTSANLGQTYNTNNAAIVTEKGVSAILTYDPKCEENNESVVNADGLPCVGVMFDSNGDEPPNKIGYDIGLLNAGYMPTAVYSSGSGSSSGSSGSGINNDNSNNSNQNASSASGNSNNNNNNNNQNTGSSSGNTNNYSHGSSLGDNVDCSEGLGANSRCGITTDWNCSGGSVLSVTQLQTIFSQYATQIVQSAPITIDDDTCFRSNVNTGFHEGYFYYVKLDGTVLGHACKKPYTFCAY